MKLMYLYQSSAVRNRRIIPMFLRIMLGVIIGPAIPITAFSYSAGIDDPPVIMREMAPFITNHTLVLGTSSPVWESQSEDDSYGVTKAVRSDSATNREESTLTRPTAAEPADVLINKGISRFDVPAVIQAKPVLLALNDAQSPMGSTAVDVGKDANVPTVEANTKRNSRSMKLMFEVKGGDKLSSAMGDFIKANGMAMQWNAPADYVIQHSYAITRKSFQETLQAILSPYGLSATLWEGNQVVEIYARSGEAE